MLSSSAKRVSTNTRVLRWFEVLTTRVRELRDQTKSWTRGPSMSTKRNGPAHVYGHLSGLAPRNIFLAALAP